MSKPYTFSFKLTAAGGPFDDPALLATPANMEAAILFDSGTLHGLKTRDLQRVRWLFLSHLHIDHLIGFDHLLRVRLFSELPLTVFGPKGTCDTIAHRLQGYAWNLTSGSPFEVRAFEWAPGHWEAAQFHCHHSFRREAFQGKSPVEASAIDGQFELSKGLTVKCHPVHHGVPCLAYRLDRILPPKFSLETAKRLGLSPGPWVSRLVSGVAVSQQVEGVERDRRWLAEKLLTDVEPHSLGYLTDTRLEPALAEELASFFRNVTVLCSETAYLEEDAELARANLHMTTSQVGELATACRAKSLRLFHLSRRYTENGPAKHLAEVSSKFRDVELLS